MAELNFESLEEDSKVEWPKRGRQKKPIPQQLADALHKSFANKSTPNMVLPKTQVDAFRNLLSRAGKELNYRIEHYVESHPDKEGFVIYHFRTKAHRKTEQTNGR